MIFSVFSVVGKFLGEQKVSIVELEALKVTTAVLVLYTGLSTVPRIGTYLHVGYSGTSFR